MKFLLKVFPLSHLIISVPFVACALALIVFAVIEFWKGIYAFFEISFTERMDSVLEALALLTVAVAGLELGQTIAEEEVLREAQMSAPTRVRRFLSRFL